jgi:Flp pilus assembly protein TadG
MSSAFRRRLGRRLGRSGQALVELALVLPIILLLVVGMLEFARAWNLHQTMTDAVREGARRAVLAGAAATWPVDSVYAAMWRYMAQAGYDPSYASMGVCNTPSSSCGSTARPPAGSNWKQTGENITVTMSFPYRIFVLGNMPITMKSTLTVRNE